MYFYDDYSYWTPRPAKSDFKLDIVSMYPGTEQRKLKKYSLDGIDTVGVFGDEKFEIHFANSSYEDAQIRVSLDGTDVLTGKPANLEINHQMWLVRAGKTLHLKAWAESNAGGASFVFTSADKSVALYTHGDVSHKGIISVAVFTDKYRKIKYSSPYRTRKSLSPEWGGYFSESSICSASAGKISSETLSFNDISERSETKSSSSIDFEKSASVGAGQYTEQRFHSVKGLDNPELNSILRVKYIWYDWMVEALRNQKGYTDPHPSGFPAESIRSFADLSGVPRVRSIGADKKPNRFEEVSKTYSNTKEHYGSFDRFEY